MGKLARPVKSKKTAKPKVSAKKAVKPRMPAKAASPGRQIGARYDATGNSPGSREHWDRADQYGPNTANSDYVRAQVRSRARHERDNDPNLNGLIKTLAYDVVGTGPRLQLTLGEEFYESARKVERLYAAWARATSQAEKLRLLDEAATVDGECFGLGINNPNVSHPVKLDLKIVESEQVATPLQAMNFDQPIDGIEFDDAGDPVRYHVLREHPGDGSFTFGFGGEFDKVPASLVYHWFRPTRPGQARGISELVSSLPLGSQTRRYKAAVLGAAELQANIAGVIETDELAAEADAPSFTDMEEIDIPRMALLTLPGGRTAKTFDSNHPAPEHSAYVADQHAEQGRPLCATRNISTGDSSNYNFSSARLDHLPYQRMVWIKRENFRVRVLDKQFKLFIVEAIGKGLIPDDLPPFEEWDYDWHWDGFGQIDPVKEATAIEKRLTLCITTLAEECAAEGKNWREVIDQRANERDYMKSRGMDPDAATKPPAAGIPPARGPENDDEEDDDTDLAPNRRAEVVYA